MSRKRTNISFNCIMVKDSPSRIGKCFGVGVITNAPVVQCVADKDELECVHDPMYKVREGSLSDYMTTERRYAPESADLNDVKRGDQY
jgi:hypothetical protein